MTSNWLGVIALAVLAIAQASPTQGPALDRLMQKKLVCSQKILEAVVTSRWADLEEQSRVLETLTRDPAWLVLNAPEYARHSNTFIDAARALHDAAAKRDLEATPQAYIALTMSCVQCHRYLARSRIATK
jgi:cytochrome c556